LTSAVYEVRRKNIVEPVSHVTMWPVGIARIPKATNTHSEYVMLIAFPL